MPGFEPQNPDFAERARSTFDRQALMNTIGARLRRVEAGEVDVVLPFRDDLTQQHGFIHAGIVSAVVDTACGLAAFTLMPKEAAVLAVEFKINFMAPAVGPEVIARGRVLRAGRTLTVCSGEAVVLRDGVERSVAQMQSTIMTVRDTELRG